MSSFELLFCGMQQSLIEYYTNTKRSERVRERMGIKMHFAIDQLKIDLCLHFAEGIYAVHLHMFSRSRQIPIVAKSGDRQSIVKHRDRELATQTIHKVRYMLHADLQIARF